MSLPTAGCPHSRQMYGIIATAPHGIGSPFSLTALKSFRLYPNAPQPEQRYRPIQAVNACQWWVWVSIVDQHRSPLFYITVRKPTLWRTIPSEDNGMIWKSIRHSFISELLTWIVVLVFAGLMTGLGLHFSIPSTAVILTMFVLFVVIYRIVSRRL